MSPSYRVVVTTYTTRMNSHAYYECIPDYDSIPDLIEAIAFRKGLGNILAEGVKDVCLYRACNITESCGYQAGPGN